MPAPVSPVAPVAPMFPVIMMAVMMVAFVTFLFMMLVVIDHSMLIIMHLVLIPSVDDDMFLLTSFNTQANEQ